MEEKRPLVIEQRGDLHFLLIRVSVVRLKTTFSANSMHPMWQRPWGALEARCSSVVWSTR